MEEYLKPIRDNIHLIKNLCEFLKTSLKVPTEPKISFIINKKNALNPLGKTAYYIPEEQKICVYIVGRHLKDVGRSISHEWIHHAQHCNNQIKKENNQEGYFLKDSDMVELERDAYERGNLIFREWEELVKAGKIKV